MTRIWKGKRILSLALALILLMTSVNLPAPIFAANEEQTASDTTEQKDPMIGKNATLKSFSFATAHKELGDSGKIVASSYYPEQMVITDVGMVGNTTYYQLSAASGKSWPKAGVDAGLADGYWLESKWVELIQEPTISGIVKDSQGNVVVDANGDPLVIAVQGEVPENVTVNANDWTDRVNLGEKYTLLDIFVQDSDGQLWQPTVGTAVRVGLPVTSGAEKISVIHFLENSQQIQYALEHGLGEVADVSDATAEELDIIADAISAYQSATGTTELKVVGEVFKDVPVVNGVATIATLGFSCYVYWDGTYRPVGEDWEGLDEVNSGTVYYVKPGESFQFDTNADNYKNYKSLWLIASNDMDVSKITIDRSRDGFIFYTNHKVIFKVADDTSLVGKTFTLTCQDSNNKTTKFQVISKDATTESVDSDKTYIALYQGEGLPTNLFNDLSSGYKYYLESGSTSDNKNVYANTSVGIIHKNVFNSSSLVETQNGVSIFWDPEGRKTLAFAELNQGIQEDIIKKYGHNDAENYVVVIYGVRKVVNGSNTEWYVICKVLHKDQVQLIYNPNLPDGFTDTSVLSQLPNNAVTNIGGSVTVGSVPENLEIHSTINGIPYTGTFIGWSSDPNARPDDVGSDTWYKEGDEILLNANMDLYAIWETNYTYNSAKIYFNNHVLDEEKNAFRNLDGEFTYTVSPNFNGCSYVIYTSVGNAVPGKSGTFSSANLSFTLVGEQYIVIDVPNSENEDYVITAAGKPGHDIEEVSGKNGYAIVGNVCTLSVNTQTNIAGEFHIDFNNIVKKYIINFDSSGDSAMDHMTYTVYDNIVLTAPTKMDSTFHGWRVTSAEGNWVYNYLYEPASLTVGTGKCGNVTLTAQWEASTTTLTIDVNFAGDYAIDGEQSFLFDISENNEVILTVAVLKDGYVTIDGLTIGKTYTVTLKNSWSWRYGVAANGIVCENVEATEVKTSSVQFVMGTDGKVTFTMKRTNDQWLDGNAYSKN